MLVALALLWYFLAFACSIASFVFFILVLVQMFKRDQSTLGIACIVLAFCSGIGMIIAFVFGWIKAAEWNLKKTMTYWTVALVLQFIFIALAIASAVGAAASMDPNQFNLHADPNDMNFEFETDGAQFKMPDGTEFKMPEGFPMPDQATPAEPSTDDVPQPEASPTDQP